MAMGGGGDQTSTVHQSNLPEYARPYYENLMQRAADESKRPYQTYGRPRIAAQTGATLTGLGQAEQFGRSNLGYMPQALSGTNTVMNQAGQEAQYQSGNFDAGVRDQYMSPYMDAVTDYSKSMAVKDAMQQQMYNDTEAARAGAFGGSRAAVMKAMGQNSLMDRLTGITVEGRQNAFENAQQQYERDRAARAQAAGIRLNALDLQKNTAGQLAGLQKQQDAMRLQRIQSLLGAGQAREDFTQQKLDLAYNDFINQRDARRQNLQFYSSLLQGVPISANSNTVTTTPSNPIAGMAGSLTGLQALYALSKQPVQ